ncbi:SDR family oxidoreductase [Brevibacillus ruminantium]|uniref:SDR family oxidoreductase n=1 Tax=Brevibacillus ruminantium TaxID=2950604 RepID=A0ABY4WG51_9BACL|nr:SDR family oxidoreductase [Brevibacillus ruminantium]USG64997.1 SDR family oxidoreductase [Brevibacillus ruminantium]
MLKEKVIIVTGAASGIGAEIARQCIAENAQVIACDRDVAKLEHLRNFTSPESIDAYPLDVTNYEEVARFFHTVKEKYPGVNGLVNNAGIYLGKSLLDYHVDEIDQVIHVNVRGFLYFSKFFGELLVRQERAGVIVNLSSVSGIEGSSDAVYGMSKAAVLGLTKSCAMSFSPYIRVNAIAPTLVETAMMDQVPDWRKKEYREHELIKSPVLPVDVANTAVFLLSEKARNYTGATFDLNNGCYLR